jgi:pimeloyl-ACP methyl ester carboxylesterase
MRFHPQQRHRTRNLNTVAVMAVLLVTALLSSAPSAQATPGDLPCDAQASIPDFSAASRPIILVHGWTGGPLIDTARLLSHQLGDPAGRWPMLQFDYHRYSTRWASEPEIAGCLAQYVDQVSAAHTKVGGDGKVIIVAHSMGGLAARFAADTSIATAKHVGGIITLDTPHLGSLWGGTVYAWGKQALSGFFNLPFPFDADAGHCLALRTGDSMPPGCALPPYLPQSVPIDQVAGITTVRRSIFGIHAYDINLGGDSIVGLDSSAGYTGSGPHTPSGKSGTPVGEHIHTVEVPCSVPEESVLDVARTAVRYGAVGTVTAHVALAVATLAGDSPAMDALSANRADPSLLQFLALANFAASCGHATIPTNADAIAAAATAIKRDDQELNGALLTAYYGNWRVHGGGLTVNRDGTAVGQGHIGNTATFEFIYEVDDYRIAPSADGTYAVLTTTDVFWGVSLGNGQWRRVPNPEPSVINTIRGDRFRLQLIRPQLLKSTPFPGNLGAGNAGNPYLCGPQITEPDVILCGA